MDSSKSTAKPNFMSLCDSPDVLAAKVAEHRESLVDRVTDDGFNPYGSGPEPIGRRK